MTGLEKILSAIEADAKHAADIILRQAEQEAEQILAAAKAEADMKSAEIAGKSDAARKAVLSRAESAAALQEKKILLEAKQQIISSIINKARQSLDSIPDQEYTQLILKMVSKYAHNKPGRILFSSADRKRLPSDLDKKIIEALKDKEAAALTVFEESAGIGGGFLLIYGDIEENCTFDALFATAKEDLQDKINAYLYSVTTEAKDSKAKA